MCNKHGMKFWDYGNSFLLEASRAGAEIKRPDGDGFIYPSYVEEIMGDIFSLGLDRSAGCVLSGSAEDLEKSDRIAA
eukprot:GABW01002036.1.p1 GENE.GABW01002036.1~~GABW01002036.1.p1  ORF type:complete len:77 (+),score=19.50 GABW01002036.1:39-269(+)